VIAADLELAIAGYPEAERTEARAIVAELVVGPEGVRVARCVVHLAGGSLAELQRSAAAARLDYRDVIWWAEYEGAERQLRDFTKPMR